jgi:signal transduction histidine kinase
MAMRPLDRLPSIRAKLGFVIVFAVAVTILIMYVTVGFALRKSERDRQFRQLLGQANAIAAVGFATNGRPAMNTLNRALAEFDGRAVVVDGAGAVVAGDLTVPSTVVLALSGKLDTGVSGTIEYIGYPVTRDGKVVGAVYLTHRVEGSGFLGPVEATASFVRSVWWQLLLAGAISAVIALGLARLLARGLTQPLRDMAGAASQLARGDYTKRVPITSRDEVGQLAEAFNRMAGEMESVERLRRDLVANVSHELKTPISALRARLENIMDGVEPADPALLAVMLQQTERLTRLVDQLLDLSRLDSGDVRLDREPLALGPLVDRVLSEVHLARDDRGIVARNEVPLDLPFLDGDRERIHQLLFNLLDNAFRFTPPGGTVVVKATPIDGACEVTVEDTGPGIPAEHLPYVFERFYRVDPSRSRDDGGTGIGLAIARSVVDAHGGRIWAESEKGTGSRFRFILPTAGTDAPTDGTVPTADSAREPTPSEPDGARERLGEVVKEEV